MASQLRTYESTLGVDEQLSGSGKLQEIRCLATRFLHQKSKGNVRQDGEIETNPHADVKTWLTMK